MADMIGDITLGMSEQATAMLHMLSMFEAPEGLCMATRAWYNGREKGFVLTATTFNVADRMALHIAVTTHRNSDHLVIDVWTGESDINPPTVETAGDAFENAERREYPFGDFTRAIQDIRDTLANFADRKKLRLVSQ